MIKQIETNTGLAFSTEVRGVAYHAQQIAGRWCVVSCRNSSKAAGFGSARWFDDLAGVETIKAFSGISALVAI